MSVIRLSQTPMAARSGRPLFALTRNLPYNNFPLSCSYTARGTRSATRSTSSLGRQREEGRLIGVEDANHVTQCFTLDGDMCWTRKNQM